MVFVGSQWFLVVLVASQWFSVVLTRFSVVLIGSQCSRRFSVVLVCSQGLSVFLVGPHRFSVFS